MKKAVKQSTMMLVLNALSIFLMFTVAVTFVLSSYFNQRIDRANTDRFNLTYNANRFMNGSAYLTDQVRAYAATGDRTHYDNYWNEINSLKNRDIGVENMREIGITQEEERMITNMSALSNELVPLEEEAMEKVQAGNLDAALRYVYGEEYNESISQISELKTQFLKTLDDRSSAEIQRLSGVVDLLEAVVWGLLMATVAVQIWNNLYNRKKVLRPIAIVKQEMEEIAGGNLSSKFDLEPDTSEIGHMIQALHQVKKTLQMYIADIQEKLSCMANGNMNIYVNIEYIGDFKPIQESLNTILRALNSTLGQIETASAQVTSGANQVAQGAQDLARGAEEQASSVDQISTTVSDITRQMELIAQDALQAKGISDEAAGILLTANEKMERLTAAMEEISSSSTEINKIIDTIENIAFQTNILALNAAVEAARAGSAGKGFAVVADEVRNLASKSSEASKNTAILIQKTLSAVQHGSAMAVDTAKTLAAVVDGAKQSTMLVEGIASTSEEQTQALKSLNYGIGQVSNVVQTTSATAEESAAASQELNAQAATLQSQVDTFRLRQEAKGLEKKRFNENNLYY